MVNLIEAIKKGIDLYSFFYSKIYGPIKFRPLSNVEVDHVLQMCIRDKDYDVKEFIRDIKFRHQPKKMLDKKQLDNLASALDDMNMWIVYHAVKDFQPEEWQHEQEGVPFGYHLLRSPDNYLEIADFADEVMSFTTQPTDNIKSFLKTKDGVALAEAVWKLNYPLANKIWELTDIQVTFLVESRNQLPRKESTSIKEAIGRNLTRIKPMTEQEVNIIKKAEEIRAKIMQTRRFT